VLTETEKRYSTFDRELLAIFAAVKKWKYLLHGNVTIFTDHKPLVGALKNPKDRDSDRQQRQITFILEYVTDVVHIAGRDNVVADTLSRTNVIGNVAVCDTVDLISIAKAQVDCVFDFSSLKPFEIDSYKLYCEMSSPNPRPFVPDSLRIPVFESLHNLSHPGWKASCRLVGSRYYWPSLKADIKKWSQECLGCQSSKVHRHVKKPLSDLPCPTQRFTRVHIDIVGPLESESLLNHRYLITMVDAHTRWCEVVPVSEITAEAVCRALMYHWVARFGPPLYLVSDRGTQFTSELLINLNRLLGIHQIRTSAYNPKANGTIERLHRTLKAALRAHQGNWIEKLPFVLLGLRTAPDEDGNSPFTRLTGEQPLVPHVLIQSGTDADVLEKLKRIEFPYKPTKTREVKEYFPKELRTCDYIWLRLDRVKRPMEAPYQGPFKVMKRTKDNFTIEVKGKAMTVAIERVKPAIFPTANTATTCSAPKCAPKCTSEDDQPAQEENEQKASDVTRTRSGRKVRFNEKNDYQYF